MHRVFAVVVVIGVTLGLACVDMSAPKGPAAISSLKLPSPSVVIGDVMRDSTGVPAPLTILSFDATGTPTVAPSAEFFIIDSTKSAHLNAGNLLTGDKIGATVIVGQIGNLQTSPVTVQVTFAPFKMAHTGTDSTLLVPTSSDTTVNAFAAMNLRVSSADDSASAGIVVKYVLLRAPATAADAKHPAVFIADNSGHPASADTTTATGSSTRRLVVVSAYLSDPTLRVGTKTDTAIVEARASYKGVLLNGAPVRFVIPITGSLK
jgi:hypothetical protein